MGNRFRVRSTDKFNRLNKSGMGGFEAIQSIIVSIIFIVGIIFVYQYILETNAPAAMPVVFPFFEDAQTPTTYTKIKEPTTLAIVKTDSLIIKNIDHIDVDEKIIRCPDFKLEKQITIDPAHGGDDTGKTLKTSDKKYSEAEELRKLAFTLVANKIGFATRDKDNPNFSERMDKIGNDMVLGIMAGDSDSVIIYYTKGYKGLACNILNNILDKTELASGNIVLTDPILISKQSPLRLLEKGGIYISIGSFEDMTQIKAIQNSAFAIIDAINAIKDDPINNNNIKT